MDLLINFFSLPGWIIELIVNVPLALFVVWMLWTRRHVSEWGAYGGLLVVMLLIGALTAVAQYGLWAHNPMTQELLTAPVAGNVELRGIHAPMLPFAYEPGGYFALYAYTRFFVPLAIGFIFAEIMYGLCVLIRQVRPNVMRGRVCFAVAGFTLILGWPGGVAFLILLAAAAIGYAFYNLSRGTHATKLDIPVTVAGLITVTCSSFIMPMLSALY